jgi:glycosyltransferase involved in cell wall biosynthesis
VMQTPLVSVVCLCYNHDRFVREAIQSVLEQTYPNIEIIAVDDASSDSSHQILTELAHTHHSINYIALKENHGICKAFNIAFARCTGEYIVDFATDDVMHPDRIAAQVSWFLSKDQSYGVVYTDATYIDENGRPFRHHMEYLKAKRLLVDIPEGDVYAHLLRRYFVASPTMLVRREVLDKLRGYDEDLAYEDFDFWIRSSRFYKYGYIPERLTFIRRSARSLSTGWYLRGDPQLYSTYLVCLKAKHMNESEDEKRALVQRVRYEFRQSVLSDNKREAELFYDLLGVLENPSLFNRFLNFMHGIGIPYRWLRAIYQRLRYG